MYSNRISRQSGDTIDIGRGNHYESEKSQFTPFRRSSTFEDYNSPPNGYSRYDEYWQEVPDGRTSRPPPPPSRYYQPEHNDYYKRRRETFAPNTHVASPGHFRHSGPSDMVGMRPRPRSPTPVNDDSEEDMIIVRSTKRVASTPTAPIGYAETSKVLHESQHVPGIFQTIFDVNHPQDASIHLELPIADDHDAELEVFSRLQRLGNFSAARDYFKSNLERYLSNPYVFVHFGQMLLDQGDYLAFERLNPEAVFGKDNRQPSRFSEDIVLVNKTQTRPGIRSRSRERQRDTRARSRNPSPIDSRPVHYARFESDLDVRPIRSQTQRSLSTDSSIHNGNLGQKSSNSRMRLFDRSTSPEGVPLLLDASLDYDELELLHQNWRLLKATCTMHRQGNFEHAFTEAWNAIEYFRFGTSIGSTEAQVVVLGLDLCAQIGRVAPKEYHASLQDAAKKWVDWPALVRQLLVQGRIWDFKDLYVAAVAAFSHSANELFFGTSDIKCSLIDDWILDEKDESTNLAQLDLLLKPTQSLPFFLDEAKARSEAIVVHSPEAMKSRPFIRWILANAAETLSGKRYEDHDSRLALKTHLQDFPGIVCHSQGWPAPNIYVPRNNENPGWAVPEISVAVFEPCQLALNLAKELGDYKSQAACYKLLISQSEDPTQLFQDLADLQKFGQGDKDGHLETLLSSYLVCKDRPAKEKLLEELEQSDDWGDATILRDRTNYWARDFIERALKRSLGGPQSTASLRRPASFYVGKGLPREAEQFTWQNADVDGLPPTARYSTDPYNRQRPVSPPRRPARGQAQQGIQPLPYELTRRHFPSPDSFAQPSSYRRDAYYLNRERQRLNADVENRRLDSEAARERERHHREEEEYYVARTNAERKMTREQEADPKRTEEVERVRHRLLPRRPVEDLDYFPEGRAGHIEWKWRARGNGQTETGRQPVVRGELEEHRATKEVRPNSERKEEEEAFDKRKKERREAEIRDQKHQEIQEHLERAKSILRDLEERRRRTEDRHSQDWLAGRGSIHPDRFHGKSVQVGGGISGMAASQAGSEASSSEWEDSDDSADDFYERPSGKYQATRMHGEEKPEREEGSATRRERRYEEHHQGEADDRNSQQNTCTALVLYSGVQSTESPDLYMVESPLQHSSASSVSSPKSTKVDVVRDATLASIRKPSKTPSTSGRKEPTLEQSQTDLPERTASITAEPKHALNQNGSESTEGTGNVGNGQSPMLRKVDSKHHSEPRSKEQNERIANRPPGAIRESWAPEKKNTGDNMIPKEKGKIGKLARFADEDINREKEYRRLMKAPKLSSTQAAQKRSRSAPSYRQERDDIHPLERRKSWIDRRTIPSLQGRLEPPERRSSLVVDADGRPRPVRTTSEPSHSYVGDESSGPHIRIRRDGGIEEGRSISQLSPKTTGRGPGRPMGLRSQSTEDVGTRIRFTGGLESSPSEKLSTDNGGRERMESSRKKRAMSSLREDAEDGEGGLPSQPRPNLKVGQSTEIQASWADPKPRISRQPTVTDIQSDEE